MVKVDSPNGLALAVGECIVTWFGRVGLSHGTFFGLVGVQGRRYVLKVWECI